MNRQLIHIVPSVHWGGVEQYCLDICRHYHGEGWDVLAVTRDAKAVDSHFMACGIPLIHALFGGYTDMGSIWMMTRLLRGVAKGCVVHVHRYSDAFTVLMARRLANRPDIRLVATRHIVAKGHDNPLARRIYSRIDANIFVSRTAMEAFMSRWPADRDPSPQDRIHILHDSLNLAYTETVEEPTRGPVTALCHGTIVAGKGFENVIDALSTLRDVKIRLRIAGNGDPDYIDSLRQRALARGVMDLIDWVIPSGDIMLMIGESHFGVQASSRREAFGLESLRYMACGRPQVCVPNGAQSEYLRNGHSAIFAPPADSAKLAEAMRRLATDPELRIRMGANALDDYRHAYAWPHFIKALDKIYTP